jgi:DNA polymerase I
MNLTIDTETTTHNKGNPFDSRNRLVSIHTYDETKGWSFKPTDTDSVQQQIDSASLLILFNAKFDLLWLRKIGIKYDHKPIYDVQLAHYMLSRQSHAFPSLDEVLEHFGLEKKLDKVKELWDQGVQTDEIPWDILCEYGEADCLKTYQAYQKQLPLFTPQMYKLFKLACQDLLILADMEWNGLKYDNDVCNQKSADLQKQIAELTAKLSAVYPDVTINFGSPDQLSAFLYGGQIKEETKELVGFYKTGQKAGQPKYQKVDKFHTLPRMFNPLPKTEMAKEGVYSTAEGTLRKLKGKNKWVIETLLELAKVSKLNETYYEGLNKINAEMHWEPGILHGQYNQCIARTGRLSSSRPNQQNLSNDCLDIFVTRF